MARVCVYIYISVCVHACVRGVYFFWVKVEINESVLDVIKTTMKYMPNLRCIRYLRYEGAG